MPRANPLQEAFNAGEFSPELAARVSFSKYPNAGARVENMFAIPQGGLTRRPGTLFRWEVKDSSVYTRLLRFQFSTEQAYPLEAGNQYFRFGRNKGRIVIQNTDAAISNGTFDSDTTGWTDQSGAGSSISHNASLSAMNLTSNGTTNAHAEQQITNTTAGEHVLRFRVLGVASDTIKLRIGTTTTGTEIVNDQELGVGWHSFAFTATAADFFVQFINSRAKAVQIDDVSLIDDAPLELTTPYTTAQLRALKFAQDANVMYIAHSSHSVMKLERRGHTSWSLVEVNWEDGPYLDQNDEASKTLNPAAATGLGIALVAAGHSPFASTDVGRLVRLQHSASSDWGYGIITAVTDAQNVTIDVLRDFAGATAVAEWQLGSWSETTGYPSVVTFFEQRAVYADNTNQPQTFWMSQGPGLENMKPDSLEGSAIETQDDDALNFTISADEVNPVLWLSPGRQLVIGTSGGEWTVISDGPIVKPSDIDVKRQTNQGSASNVDPIRIDAAVLFLQDGRRKLLEFAFVFDVDGFRSPSTVILSEHVTRTGVLEMAYAKKPTSLVVCVRTDGVLAVLTYRREEDVIGWGRWILGGSFGAGAAVAESVTAIPGNSATNTEEENETWVIVKRTINGATKRYVEVFEPAFEGPNPHEYDTEAEFDTAVLAAQKDAHYVDSGLEYDGVATTSITGLDHLEGETVKVLADGAIHADKVVSGGAITLDASATKVRAGLGYFHKFKSLKNIAGAAAGTTVGKTQRLSHIGFELLHSMRLKQGPTIDDLEANDFRVVTDMMDQATPLFTGHHRVEFDGDWDLDPRIVFADDAPVPFTVLAMAPEAAVNEQL